jgi:hypothetical protein
MTTFAWLFIGHLVGDWLLQNDWMAKGKKQGIVTTAGLVHLMIYTLVMLCVFRLSGVADKSFTIYLIVGAVVFVSHWLIDCTSLVDHWMLFYHQSRTEIVRLMVDQTLHLLILAVLVATV